MKTVDENKCSLASREIIFRKMSKSPNIFVEFFFFYLFFFFFEFGASQPPVFTTMSF